MEKYHNESEVITKFIIPLFEKLDYKKNNWEQEYPVEWQRGSSRERRKTKADIVYFMNEEHEKHNQDTSLVVVEAKNPLKALDSNVEKQAHFYGAWLKVPYYFISNGKEVKVILNPILRKNEVVFACKVDEINVRFPELYKLLSKTNVINFVERFSLKKVIASEIYKKIIQNYKKTILEKLNKIKIIGTDKQLDFERTYVKLKLVEEYREREFRRSEEAIREILEKDMKGKREEGRGYDNFKSKEKLIGVDQALKKYKKLIILGDAGTGKTTLLQHISYSYSKDLSDEGLIPFFITLADFSYRLKETKNYNLSSLFSYIASSFDEFEFPDIQQILKDKLKRKKCIFLFDGLDEVTNRNTQNQIIDLIENLSSEYSQNTFIVSSRIGGFGKSFRNFKLTQIAELDDKGIQKLIENIIGDKKESKDLYSQIKKNVELRTIAKIPFLLTIITVVRLEEPSKKISANRVELYHRCIRYLLKFWPERKGLKTSYPFNKSVEVLQNIAYHFHLKGKRFFDDEELYNKADDLLKSDVISGENFIDTLSKESGLLIRISQDKFSFIHLSFQEFFTALEINKRNALDLLIAKIDSPWWSNVILLYAGIKKDATALIKKIKKEVPEDIFHSNLILFGKCIADADSTEFSLREEIVKELWALYQTSEFFSLRKKAIKILALIKPDDIIDSLIKELKAKDRYVRGRAAKALGNIGDEKAVESLIGVLTTEEDVYVQPRVADALGDIGSEKAIKLLIKVFTTAKESSIRKRVAYALGRIGSEEAIEPLSEALTTAKEWRVREVAANALGRIGSEKALQSLIKALTTDEESVVREGAAIALGRIGSEEAIEPLIKALTLDKGISVRWKAATALGWSGSKEAIKPLIEVLTNDKESCYVREFAAEALGDIGNEKALQPLIKALTTDEESDVREVAANALGRIGSEKALQPLIKALSTDEESDVRGRAAKALGNVGSKEAIKPLIEVLTNDKESCYILGFAGYVREFAAEALGDIGSEKALQSLIKALSTDEESDVRGRAAKALGNVGSEKALQSLIEALSTDEESDVRGRAAKALGNVGSEKAIPPLKNALEDEGEWFLESKVKDTAFTSLEKISRRIKKRIALEPT